jgi:hypothetical protein
MQIEIVQLKMKPDVKNAWLQALRFDNYTQIKGRLCKGVRYESQLPNKPKCRCVMGVLADIYMLGYSNVLWDGSTDKLVITTAASRYIRQRVRVPEYEDKYRWETVRKQQYEQREPATFVLPQQIMEWAGLEYRDDTSVKQAGLQVSGELLSISKLNDTHDITFHQLADLIEGQL